MLASLVDVWHGWTGRLSERFSCTELFSNFFLATLTSRPYFLLEQHVIIDTGDRELDLNVSDDHGKCSAIFVGAVPSEVQYKQLTEYSAKFKVRVNVWL